jgi:outer membrane lipoprotein LolB
LALAACAVSPPRPPPTELERLWTQRLALLQPITHWELRGRLAVQTDDRGGQASLVWQRDDRRQSIRLNGPLGRGVMRVTQDERGARLHDSEGRVMQAADAEQLVLYYTGWQLPIAHLDWWLRGLPVPGIDAARELDGAGRLESLRQQEWTVRYQAYVQVAGYELPGRLTVSRAANPPLPALEARFVIDRWGQVK